MANIILGTSEDGIRVYYHPEGHSHRADLNKEVISKITIADRPFVRETVSLGRTIGVDHLVSTTEDDKVVLWTRPGRKSPSRMVLNRQAADTDRVTVIIAKCGEEDGDLSGKYALVTLFEGEPGMPERDDDPECREFWTKYALVPTDEELKLMRKEGLA